MKIGEAMEEALNFKGLQPTKIDTNVGGVWFTDKSTSKEYFILVDECSK